MNTEVTVGERQVENRTPTIARPMIASPWSSPLRQLLFLHVVQFCLVAMVLYFSLQLHRKNLSVPFDFWGDTMQILANVTAIIRTGWYWSNPLLSAPFSFPIIAFPSNNSVDYAIVWLIARFSSNPGLILNLSWLLF